MAVLGTGGRQGSLLGSYSHSSELSDFGGVGGGDGGGVPGFGLLTGFCFGGGGEANIHDSWLHSFVCLSFLRFGGDGRQG